MHETSSGGFVLIEEGDNMDLSDLGSSPEDSLLTLLSHEKLNKAAFAWGAEQALGPEWRTLGKTIVEENAPELMPKFLQYIKE